ncbi:SAM-dependent methyltransferase [Saccharopolyspora elongata]|uniref:Methyltransferase domain-containing protein n=1 Tax=Saccharopolyspora elongata TaxID=2530387 RepID=A0A4R4Y7F0_9PSEU|nr:methyltransferase domain-containing protein [Saccharopolyspora elongata]TDD39549.1 methyltransferase domain-containing protein [Saccharopolyspora elongata]
MNRAQRPSPGAGETHDEHGDVFTALLDGSLHFGLWDDATRSMREAADNMTDLMIEKLAVEPARSVLDIGCGIGEPAVRLARARNVDVVGINVSRQQLAAATERATVEGLQDRVRFAFADALDLPFPPESFDAAWFFESLLHMPDRRRALSQAARVLRPGGRLAVADFIRRGPDLDEQTAVEERLAGFHISAMPTLEDYAETVADAGLVMVEAIDVSDRSWRQTLAVVQENIARLQHTFTTPSGQEDYWAEAREMLPRIADGSALGYAVFVAAKPRG